MFLELYLITKKKNLPQVFWFIIGSLILHQTIMGDEKEGGQVNVLE